MPNPLLSFLDQSPLSHTRRNHGLEHATIHLLSRLYPQRSFIGRSDPAGFYIFGRVETSQLEDTVHEALQRLRAGEHQLAIHPNCGTNLVTSALLAGGASFIALMGSDDDGWRRRLDRLPNAILLTIGALMLAHPLGHAAQKHITVQSNPGDLEILGIHRLREDPRPLHRIVTSI